MQERNQSRLASTITFLIGLWLALSPIWIAMPGGAQASTITAGIVIVVASIVQFFTVNNIASWIIGIAAVWTFISAFGYSGLSGGAMTSLILSAIATFAVAIWDGREINQYADHSQHAGAHV